MSIVYDWSYGNFINNSSEYESLLNEFSDLYSENYGKWGNTVPSSRIGKNVKLTPARIREWLNSKSSSVYWAKDDDKLVGYAIAVQVDYPKHGVISWVTQLVVHESYRNQGIAKDLLLTIWGFSDDFAWGIVSANPYAIRALEKTTRRRAIPLRIKNNLHKIISVGAENIPYITSTIENLVNEDTSKINTEFPIDHSEVQEMINSVVNKSIPWTLGSLDEGWEWLAFTFRDQIPFELEKKEITHIINTADKVAKISYERMNYDTQSWASNTDQEVEFIIAECNLSPGDLVIDFGCGTGRHALLLAEKGMRVLAVDYVDRHIKEANKNKEAKNLKNITFFYGDCRSIELEKAKAAICLYDVVGSYVNNSSNQQILNNIQNHLMKNGTAIISVMNYALTKEKAKYKFSMTQNPNNLLTLKPSTIQERTGNIFDPDYYMIETDSPGVVYRREQFKRGRTLPIELIVRDRRFTKCEIENMCLSAGLEVNFSRFVNSGGWNTNRKAIDDSAKEILIKCQKR